jgi:hypothetical protein
MQTSGQGTSNTPAIMGRTCHRVPRVKNNVYQQKQEGEQSVLLPSGRVLKIYSLEWAQVDGGNFTVPTAFRLIVNLLTFTQSRQARAFNSRNVHKHIVTAFIRLDEAITLLAIEPLDSAARH